MVMRPGRIVLSQPGHKHDYLNSIHMLRWDSPFNEIWLRGKLKICHSLHRYHCRKIVQGHGIQRSINPRPVGGGPICPPPCGFSWIGKKTAAPSAAKYSVPSRASIWHQHTKFQVIGHLRSGVIEVKLRSCWSKNEQKSYNLETPT